MNKEEYKREIIDAWIESDEPIELVNKRFEILDSKQFGLYKFILNYSNYFNIRRDYGTGEKLTMMESHIITDIVDIPGITVTELAKRWEKTNSAISQIVRRLLKSGYIERVNSSIDGKVYHLLPTMKAKEFAIAHKRYDNIDIVKTTKRLLRKFTVEELMAFDEILIEYSKLLSNAKLEALDVSND